MAAASANRALKLTLIGVIAIRITIDGLGRASARAAGEVALAAIVEDVWATTIGAHLVADHIGGAAIGAIRKLQVAATGRAADAEGAVIAVEVHRAAVLGELAGIPGGDAGIQARGRPSSGDIVAGWVDGTTVCRAACIGGGAAARVRGGAAAGIGLARVIIAAGVRGADLIATRQEAESATEGEGRGTESECVHAPLKSRARASATGVMCTAHPHAAYAVRCAKRPGPSLGTRAVMSTAHFRAADRGPGASGVPAL